MSQYTSASDDGSVNYGYEGLAPDQHFASDANRPTILLLNPDTDKNVVLSNGHNLMMGGFSAPMDRNPFPFGEQVVIPQSGKDVPSYAWNSLDVNVYGWTPEHTIATWKDEQGKTRTVSVPHLLKVTQGFPVKLSKARTLLVAHADDTEQIIHAMRGRGFVIGSFPIIENAVKQAARTLSRRVGVSMGTFAFPTLIELGETRKVKSGEGNQSSSVITLVTNVHKLTADELLATASDPDFYNLVQKARFEEVLESVNREIPSLFPHDWEKIPIYDMLKPFINSNAQLGPGSRSSAPALKSANPTTQVVDPAPRPVGRQYPSGTVAPKGNLSATVQRRQEPNAAQKLARDSDWDDRGVNVRVITIRDAIDAGMTLREVIADAALALKMREFFEQLGHDEASALKAVGVESWHSDVTLAYAVDVWRA